MNKETKATQKREGNKHPTEKQTKEKQQQENQTKIEQCVNKKLNTYLNKLK
jgi:hypothetical protein